ncbi:hypothetical protein [Marispirochaeta aestuarii]|uniref:hypothetical protein n=1 Tax=Marispirochaeta aestuarii TaxID=1963862 RepID=UPI002ABD712A|nr:hypothetical protein [Marispirochaeta aestuarii]
MGKYNSSLTRVAPLLDHLRKRDDFPNNLISTINNNYKIEEKPVEIRYGKNEKAIMPSKALLYYLVNNLELLNRSALGVDDGTEEYRLRQKLFNFEDDIRSIALELIKGDKKCLRKWYVFEGYTHPDIYIETRNYIIVGEAKRTERKFTKKTKWLNERDQFIRHIDSVIDSGKQILSFLLIDESYVNTDDYKVMLRNYKSREYFYKNLPHRDEKEIEFAKRSYIGFSTWKKFKNKYGVQYIDEI